MLSCIVQDEDNSDKLKCLECNVLISVHKNSRYANAKKHVQYAAHIAKVAAISGDELVKKAAEKVMKIHGNVFIRKGTCLMCVDCQEKGQINLVKSKNPLLNAMRHVKSAAHCVNAKKSGASQSKKMTGFVKAKAGQACDLPDVSKKQL